MRSFIISCVLFTVCFGCAGSLPVKQQEYARLASERTFEYPMPRIWKSVEESLRKYRVRERDPRETPDPVDLGHLSEAVWETDWIYGRSRHKYTEYSVNGLPKKQYLQNRVRYTISANRVVGGTHIKISMREEVEELGADGSSRGFTGADPDSALANDFLEKLQRTLHSLP